MSLLLLARAFRTPVPPEARFLLVVLCEHAQEPEDEDEAPSCWPSVERLTSLTGMAPPTIRRWTSYLVTHGYISTRPRPGDGDHLTYEIHEAKLGSLDAVDEGRGEVA